MSELSRKFLIGLFVFLATAFAVGWFHGEPLIGLLLGAVITLIYNIRYLLAFERALRNDDFAIFRYGDGIWQYIFSQYKFQRTRADRHKATYRSLLREIRRSTNAMFDGAVVLNANNEIIFCNRAAKNLAGIKRKKDRGRRVDNIIRAPALSKLLQSGDYAQSVEIPSPLNPDVRLSCRVAPYGGSQKLLFLRDITERLRVNKMRRDFVANASHELRSPLTVISGYVDALVDYPDLPEQWTQPAIEMRSQTQRMGRIIDELLELSRLESAGLADDKHFVDMGSLITRVSEQFSIDPDHAHVRLQIESNDGLLGSATEIESVIQNLIANAIRHTATDGDITVTWRRLDSGAELRVSDTGEGIAEEHLPRLTERFFRVDRGRSRADGGVGLGLSIVKHVLGRHEAELSISSEIDVGTRFSCVFPEHRISEPFSRRSSVHG
ncbi:MAG: phosphate regulon sensor histidine kinase PhoR [Woeseiaceae bacterium]|nr:phosphate regulon sensor histidine kinase PhoR [Woeseiaceae bacterium]